MKRDRFPYSMSEDVRAALEVQSEKSGAPIQTIIDRAVRSALRLPPKKKTRRKRGA